MQFKFLISIFVIAFSAVHNADAAPAVEADRVFHNGQVYTIADKQRSASAIAVKDGKFIFVGSDRKAKKYIGASTEVVDLDGRAVIPGLYDTHVHALSGAMMSKFGCGFSPNFPFEQVLQILRACVNNMPGDYWIEGGMWSTGFLKEERRPTLEILDEIAPERAVILRDLSGHNIWVNSAALRLGGISEEMIESFGGLAERDPKTGKITGVFMEDAAWAVESAMPRRSDAMLKEAFGWVASEALKFGIVGFKGAFTSPDEMRAAKLLDDEGSLHVNFAGHMPWVRRKNGRPGIHANLIETRNDYETARVKTDFIKIFLDGIPLTKTAAMLKPYPSHGEGAPHYGEVTVDPETLARDVTRFDAEGLMVKIHTAGDRAVRVALDAFEAARETNGDDGPRHEIAHACMVDETDLARFKGLNIVPEFSPAFWFPGDVHELTKASIGSERAAKFCAVSTMVNDGTQPTYGSDWPVAPSIDPWGAIEALVTRKDPTGRRPEESLWPAQRISIDDAMRMVTINGAKAQRISDRAGSIEIGKNADFLILNHDVFKVDASEISETRPLMTVFEGQIVYSDMPKSEAAMNAEKEAEKEKVRAVVNDYAKATYTANIALFDKVFHPQTTVHGYLGDRLIIGPISLFVDQMAANPSLESGGAPYDAKITSVELGRDIATATLVETGFGNDSFTNFFHLVKIDGEWKILSKTFASE